jgi:hypothetical protein
MGDKSDRAHRLHLVSVLLIAGRGIFVPEWCCLAERQHPVHENGCPITHEDPVLEGLVRSTNGAVPGAELFIYPDDRSGFGLLERARTDPEGRFRIVAPRHTPRATMTIRAPGYPFTLTEVAVDPARPLMIHLSQSGGRLVFEAAEPGALQNAFLFSGGAFLALRVLHNAGIASIGGNTVTIDHMAAGKYQICVTSTAEAPLLAGGVREGSGCVGGFLAPGGELILRQSHH